MFSKQHHSNHLEAESKSKTSEPLFELTVLASNGSGNDFCNHSSVIIKDCVTNKYCRVSFFESSSNAAYMLPEEKDGLYYINRVKEQGGKIVKLFSNANLNLADFIEEINNKFCCFGWVIYNCSDASLYTLKRFCPPSPCINFKYQAYKLVTFPCCLVTVGTTPFFGSPPLTNGPLDVIRKAQYLTKYYGEGTQLNLPLNNNKNGVELSPPEQKMQL